MNLIINTRADQPTVIDCKYCVDFGVYSFPTKNVRDQFYLNPLFKFDFQPSNADADDVFIKIFGSTNFLPKYKKNPPDFKTTYLEKDPADKRRLIISVELEMRFELTGDVATFRKWVAQDESTWRYTGRIECDGEDGLEYSEREEYEFFWK